MKARIKKLTAVLILALGLGLVTSLGVQAVQTPKAEAGIFVYKVSENSRTVKVCTAAYGGGKCQYVKPGSYSTLRWVESVYVPYYCEYWVSGLKALSKRKKSGYYNHWLVSSKKTGAIRNCSGSSW